MLGKNRYTESFLYRSTYPCTAEELYRWHSLPGALERLLPPWEDNKVVGKSGGIEPGGSVQLCMHFGPLPFSYHGRHIENEPGRMFRDIQESGPFASWQHSHYFHNTADGAELRDEIQFSLPCHQSLPARLINRVNKKLTRLFSYREHVLREDIKLHQRCSKTPLRLLLSGASGVLGRDLIPLLTTGGHHVYTLVRRAPQKEKGEIFWNPEEGTLNMAEVPEVDGVIHLAGEYIGLSRWNEDKKKRVIDSRIKGTNLLAKTLAALPRPPKVFLSASAVGYYGDCGSEILEETHETGSDFISTVCKHWEEATAPAKTAGIRTVLMRMGVGLTPKGGALRKIMTASPFGFIKCFGSGQQYISWISSDDMIAAMLHLLTCPAIEGPVNIAAPEPVTNCEFMRILADITGKPLLFPLPSSLLRLLYGQMASEILLSSCRASVAKLHESGFRFRHPSLETALRTMLGKMQNPTPSLKEPVYGSRS